MDWNLHVSGSGDGDQALQSFQSLIGHLQDSGHTVKAGSFSASVPDPAEGPAPLHEQEAPSAVDPAAAAVAPVQPEEQA